MSQEPLNNDRSKLPRGYRPGPGGEDNNTPKKGPRFSIYWIYAIIFAVLIAFQFLGGFTSNLKQIDQGQFEQMLIKGDVKEYVVVSNRNSVKVTLKSDRISNY